MHTVQLKISNEAFVKFESMLSDFENSELNIVRHSVEANGKEKMISQSKSQRWYSHEEFEEKLHEILQDYEEGDL